MVGSNKILTVSYGTFSCTLEGFDDSFDTMKAIAEYFRDLAADDRYFGAEPPTPDAEMLARIAEREIERRVEARFGQEGIVLTATDSEAPAPLAAPEAETPTEASAALAAEEPTKERAEEPQIEAASAAALSAASLPAEIIDDIIDEVPTAQTELAAAPAPSFADPESVAAKLQRIRAVVSKAGPGAGDYTEDQHADAAFAAYEEAEVTDALAGPETFEDETDAQDVDISALLHGAEDHSGDDADEGTGDDTADLELKAEAEEETGADDVAPIDLEQFLDITAAEDTVAETAEDTGAANEEPAEEPAEELKAEPAEVVAAEAMPEDIAAEAENAETDADDSDAEEAQAVAPRVRVLKVKSTEFEAAIAEGRLEAIDPATEEALDEAADDEVEAISATSLSPEDEDDLMRELAELETAAEAGDEAAPIVDELALLEDEDSADAETRDLELEALDALGEDAEAAPEDADTAEEFDAETLDAETLDAAIAEADTTEADIAAALSGVFDETGAADEEPAFDAELETVEGADTTNLFAEDEVAAEDDDNADDEDDALGRRGRLRRDRSDEEAEMSRILAKTNDQLDEPDGSRRRTAIAHLKAAVAATRAETRAGGRIDSDDDGSDEFRKDLAQVVRPRRPETGGTRSQRPETKAAPLKLVAEQRIDTPSEERAPVRPRRVSAATVRDEAPVASADVSFSEFAEEMGATRLPDLLEAAAAYMSHVEGRDQFSRPQLMTKVRQVEMDQFSREDGLRVFGQLLRQGKIQKLKGGRFTVSEDIGFKPEAKSA